MVDQEFSSNYAAKHQRYLQLVALLKYFPKYQKSIEPEYSDYANGEVLPWQKEKLLDRLLQAHDKALQEFILILATEHNLL